MPLLSGITSFLDKYILGFAIGTAAGPSLEPFVQDLANEAWSINQVRPLDAETLAAIVAEDVQQLPWGQGEAHLTGVDDTRFGALVGEALNAPGIGELYQLWRRNLIGDADFVHGLRKAKLETRWDAPLEGLRDVLLSSEELAMGQQQGFVSQDQANAEGGLQGVTPERQQLRFEMAGLPPGVETALQMLRRGIIDAATFAQIVREGHTKTKYTDDLLQLEKQILSAATYVRAFLKGHITRAEMHAGGALWGYSPADLDLWYESEGRPATVHEIHIGYARGAKLPGASDEHDAILKAVAQSDIRPEYGDLLYASRYSYPSAFVLRSLTQTGAISRDDAEQVLLFEGWEPTFAAKVADAWAGGGTSATSDPHESKAQTQLWTATHRSYVAAEIDDSAASSALTTAGVAASAIPAVISTWTSERDLIRKQLSPAQIRKAYKEQVLNPATGIAWTWQDAIDALLARGYTENDARTLLAE